MITIPAQFDNSEKCIEITSPSDPSGTYHIYIENDYQGDIYNSNGKWMANITNSRYLTNEDSEILGSAINFQLPGLSL